MCLNGQDWKNVKKGFSLISRYVSAFFELKDFIIEQLVIIMKIIKRELYKQQIHASSDRKEIQMSIYKNRQSFDTVRRTARGVHISAKQEGISLHSRVGGVDI